MTTQSKFIVEESFKGSLKSEAVIYGNIEGDCGCNYVFEPGVRYLVFANRRDNKYQTRLCKFVAPVESILDTLKEVKAWSQ